MSFIAKNPLSIPKVIEDPSTPPGTRGLFAKKDGWYEVDDDGRVNGLQTKTDAGLNTTDKTVVGAINEVNANKAETTYVDNQNTSLENTMISYTDTKLDDYYKKNESDTKYATKTTVETKADKSTTYTKTEVDNKNTTVQNSAINSSKVYTDGKLADYYKKTECNNTFETITNVNTKLNNKANKLDIPEALFINGIQLIGTTLVDVDSDGNVILREDGGGDYILATNYNGQPYVKKLYTGKITDTVTSKIYTIAIDNGVVTLKEVL